MQRISKEISSQLCRPYANASTVTLAMDYMVFVYSLCNANFRYLNLYFHNDF